MEARLVIGADGVRSSVRDAMMEYNREGIRVQKQDIPLSLISFGESVSELWFEDGIKRVYKIIS